MFCIYYENTSNCKCYYFGTILKVKGPKEEKPHSLSNLTLLVHFYYPPAYVVGMHVTLVAYDPLLP